LNLLDVLTVLHSTTGIKRMPLVLC